MYENKKLRLEGYDYSRTGYYFITVCAHDRRPVFARIKRPVTVDGVSARNQRFTTVGAGLAPAPTVVKRNTMVELTEIGKIIKRQWMNIHDYYSGVITDAFVIMPDHIHGIIGIDHAVALTESGTHLGAGVGPGAGTQSGAGRRCRRKTGTCGRWNRYPLLFITRIGAGFQISMYCGIYPIP